MPQRAVPLFARVLGGEFDRLPATVQRLHRNGSHSYHGEVSVKRGRHWLARLCAWVARLPPAFVGAIRVDIEADAIGERWARHVDGRAMRSRLWAARGLLRERLGPLVFGFRLGVREARLEWSVAQVALLGLPLPARLFDEVRACESEHDGRYRFDVSAHLPGIGLLVHYRGWLDVD